MQRYNLALVFGLLGFSCGSQPQQPLPPPPPQPTTVAQSAQLEQPPAAPDCKSLDESCTVGGVVRLKLASIATIEPPIAWRFGASEEQGIRLATPDGGALIAFIRLDSVEPDVVWSRLYALLAELEITGVAPNNVDLRKPHGKWNAHGLEVMVWQVEKGQQLGKPEQGKDPEMGGEPGALLMALTQVDSSNAVLGVGFLKRSAPKDLVHPIRITMESLTPRAVGTVDSAPTSNQADSQ